MTHEDELGVRLERIRVDQVEIAEQQLELRRLFAALGERIAASAAPLAHAAAERMM
jgi:hypothetical protein